MHPAVIWAGIGLVSGVLAKLIMPGKDKGGLITTILLGIGGSLLGGWLGHRYGITTDTGELSVLSVLTAVGGALVLLVVFRLLRLLI